MPSSGAPGACGANPLLVTFYLGVALLFLDSVRPSDPDPFASFFLSMGALALMILSAIGLIAHAMWRPNDAKGRRVAIALALAGLSWVASEPAHALVTRLAWARRRPLLDDVVREVLTDHRVRSLSTAARYYKDINGTLVGDLPPGDDVEPSGPPDAVPAARVLERDGISPEEYAHLRASLARGGVLDLDVQPGYVAFVEGGMLDNLLGVLWVRPGFAPPLVGSHLGRLAYDLTWLEPLGDGWYRYATT